MILIGDENIKYETIEKIAHRDDISKTSPSSTVLFNFSLEILKYTQANDINSAVVVNSIKEVIYAHNLGAKYIIISREDILLQSQKIADNYMFDSKILAVIENSEEIEKNALHEIDGIIYKTLL
jgi:hypothetical protein